ncbi:formyl transferase [Cyathus striatus]|nr:formyl transferase [Cyathus striatus]
MRARFSINSKRPICCFNGFSQRSYCTSAKSKFKILFMGRDEFSCTVFEQLHSAKDIWEEIVIATYPQLLPRSKIAVAPLKILGQSLGVEVCDIPHTKPGFRSWQLPPPFPTSSLPSKNHVIITASFGRIIPLSMLKMFLPERRLNVHPSLLPAYRGPAPLQHTIWNGETESGVGILQMLPKAKGIDTGGLWATSKLPVPDRVSFQILRDALGKEGGRLLVSVLRDMQAGTARSAPQPEGCVRPAPMISPENSMIDFDSMAAEAIERRHRAISHQHMLRTSVPSHKHTLLFIHNPSVLEVIPENVSLSPQPGTATFHKPSKSLLIRCAEGSVLSVPQVHQERKKPTSAMEWWNGMRGLGIVKDGQLQLGPISS